MNKLDQIVFDGIPKPLSMGWIVGVMPNSRKNYSVTGRKQKDSIIPRIENCTVDMLASTVCYFRERGLAEEEKYAKNVLASYCMPVVVFISLRMTRKMNGMLDYDEVFSWYQSRLDYLINWYDVTRTHEFTDGSDVPPSIFISFYIRYTKRFVIDSSTRKFIENVTIGYPGEFESSKDGESAGENNGVEDKREERISIEERDILERVLSITDKMSDDKMSKIARYHLDGFSIDDIGKKIGVCRERVRQIEVKFISLAKTILAK